MRSTKLHNKNSVGGIFSSTGAKTSSLTGKAGRVWMISSLKDFNSGTLRGQETMNQRCTHRSEIGIIVSQAENASEIFEYAYIARLY